MNLRDKVVLGIFVVFFVNVSSGEDSFYMDWSELGFPEELNEHLGLCTGDEAEGAQMDLSEHVHHQLKHATQHGNRALDLSENVNAAGALKQDTPPSAGAVDPSKTLRVKFCWKTPSPQVPGSNDAPECDASPGCTGDNCCSAQGPPAGGNTGMPSIPSEMPEGHSLPQAQGGDHDRSVFGEE